MAKKKQFVVMGLGRFGFSVAKTLSEHGCEVLAISNDKDIVEAASEFVTHAVCLDVMDEASLRSLGIGNFDVAIIAIGDHLDASVMATLTAKEMGIPHVVAKAQNVAHQKILKKIGADSVVFPEREMGVRIANSLMYGNFVEFIELSEEFSIVEFEPLKEWVGKTLAQSEIRAAYHLNVLAVRSGKRTVVSPTANHMIHAMDILVVMGSNLDIQRVMNKRTK